VSKEDHRAAAEHVLRLGEAQRARAGAGDAGGTRGGSGRRRNVERRGESQRGPGKWRARCRRAHGTAQRGAGAAGAWHRAGEAAAVRRVEKERRRGLEVGEGDLFAIS
jgi:hypothetical protein